MTEPKVKESLDVGFDKIVNSLLMGVHTCLPALVTSFNAAEQTVSVQPANKRLYTNEDEAELLPTIEDVPVVFMGNNIFRIVFDLLPGDAVLLICAERSIEKFLNTGAISDPDSGRKFDLSDAIAIPGLIPLTQIFIPPVQSGELSIRNKTNTVYLKLTATGVEGFNIKDTTLGPGLSVGLPTHTHPVSGAATGPPTPGT